MNLGALIDTLAALPGDARIRLDNGEVGELMSWRGVYAELTLTPGRADKPKTVAEVLSDAVAADGGTFEGYKGGDFTMDRSTPVWADDYGDCRYNAISGVTVFQTVNGPVVTIHTVNIGDYR